MCLSWKSLFVLKVIVYSNIIKEDKWGGDTELFYFINSHFKTKFFFHSISWNTPASVLTSLAYCVVDRVLTCSKVVRLRTDSEADEKALQRVIWSALKMTNSCFPSQEDIYTSRCKTREKDMMTDDCAALKLDNKAEQQLLSWGH